MQHKVCNLKYHWQLQMPVFQMFMEVVEFVCTNILKSLPLQVAKWNLRRASDAFLVC